MRLASLLLLCCLDSPVLSLSRAPQQPSPASSDASPADTDRYYSISCRQGSGAGCLDQQQLDYEEADETPLIQRSSRHRNSKTALFPPALSILDQALIPDTNAEQLLAAQHDANNGFGSKHHSKFAYVGCYPLLEHDSIEGDEAKVKLKDMSCARRPKKPPAGPIVPCRSGLPFYSYLFDTRGADDCPRFCSSKGLDIAGTLARDNKSTNKFECRCGASRSNVAAWQRVWPDKRLEFEPNGSVHPNDPLCKIIVFKYSGGFEDLGMPLELIALDEDDMKYMKDVLEANPEPPPSEMLVGPNHPQYVQGEIGNYFSSADLEKIEKARQAGLSDTGGHLLETEAGLGVNKNGTGGSLLETEGQRSKIICSDRPDTGLTIGGKPATCSDIAFACSRTDAVGDAIKRSCLFTCGLCTNKDKWTDCYPNDCGASPVWKTQNSEGNFIIRYVFDWEVDDIRKDAFREATKRWESGTCIRFYEGGDKPRVRIQASGTSACYASTGYPGDDGEAIINMGFCRTLQHLGNIIHEIGHTLGMDHTQKRPDATGRIWLPDKNKYEGPYLKVFWQNIPEAWQPQYFPDKNSYHGSGNQQAGDPSAGYAAYDYGSIMHYSTGFDRFTASNPAYDSVVGQRKEISQGDFRQINDMYQCGTKVNPDLVKEVPETQSWNPLGWFSWDESTRYQWVAGPYGDCKKRETPTTSGTECFRTRKITCEDWNAESVDGKHCVAAQKPVKEERCDDCQLGCVDRYPTLLKMGGQDISCYQLKSQCNNDTQLGTHVRQVCPRTCGKCPDNSNSEPDCRDMSPYPLILDVFGKLMSCEALAKEHRCQDFADSPKVRERCPVSCGQCPPKKDKKLEGPPCDDDNDFRTSDRQSCHVFAGYNCSTLPESEAVMEACPKSCDLCKWIIANEPWRLAQRLAKKGKGGDRRGLPNVLQKGFQG